MRYSEIMKLPLESEGCRFAASGDWWVIFESAIIAESAQIGAFSKIGPCVEIGNDVQIGSYTSILEEAVISESVTIAAEVRIGPHVHVVGSPLQIVGPKYTVYPYTPGIIGIGCQIGSIAQWEEHFESWAEEYYVPDADVLLYRCYVELIHDWMIEAKKTGTFTRARKAVRDENR